MVRDRQGRIRIFSNFTTLRLLHYNIVVHVYTAVDDPQRQSFNDTGY